MNKLRASTSSSRQWRLGELCGSMDPVLAPVISSITIHTKKVLNVPWVKVMLVSPKVAKPTISNTPARPSGFVCLSSD